MGRSSNSFTGWINQANIPGARVLMPEERLFVAVLSQAVHDAFSTHVDRYNRDAARAFFMGNTRRFRDICELAGRESQYVYEKVKKRILTSQGWNMDESMRKSYRQSCYRSKRGRPKKKHLTGNAYYAAMGKKGGRPRIYNKIET